METSYNTNSNSAYQDTGKGYGASGYTKEGVKGGGRDFATPHKVDKDPHHHWRDAWGNSNGQNNRSWIVNALMQWPIQMNEKQLQFIFASKADYIGATSALISDVDFRWLGIRNIGTIIISLSSLLCGMILFLVIALAFKTMLFSYLALLLFLSHSFFPGYVIYRLKRYVIGEAKTQRYASIIRKSWIAYEGIYVAIVFLVYFVKDLIDWVVLKQFMLDWLVAKKVLKKLLYRFVEVTPIEKMGFILEHLVNGMLIGLIVYILAMLLTNKASIATANEMKESIDKEHLRPAQIVKNKARRV